MISTADVVGHTNEAPYPGNCGETFETLTGLRLHDCPEAQEAIERDRQKRDNEGDTKIRKLMREEDSAVRRRISDDLTDVLERAANGDYAAVCQALAQYERSPSEEWENYEEVVDHQSARFIDSRSTNRAAKKKIFRQELSLRQDCNKCCAIICGGVELLRSVEYCSLCHLRRRPTTNPSG